MYNQLKSFLPESLSSEFWANVWSFRIHPWKPTWHWKIPIFNIGNTSSNGEFSIANLVFEGVHRNLLSNFWCLPEEAINLDHQRTDQCSPAKKKVRSCRCAGSQLDAFHFAMVPRWSLTSFFMEPRTPYKWLYKWVTGVITPIGGVITILIPGRGPSCRREILHV